MAQIAVNGHLNELQGTLDTELSHARPFLRKPLEKAAKHLSRRNSAEAQAIILRDELARFIAVLYETDDRGTFWNLNRAGRIQTYVLWSKRNYWQWGITRIQADVLRHTMMHSDTPFFLDDIENRWYLDLDNYPLERDCLKWLRNQKFDAATWRRCHEQYKKFTTQNSSKNSSGMFQK